MAQRESNIPWRRNSGSEPTPDTCASSNSGKGIDELQVVGSHPPCFDLQDLVDVTQGLVIALDTDGQLLFINKGGCQLIGADFRELIGKNWFEKFIPARDRRKRIAEFRKMVSSGSAAGMCTEHPVLTLAGDEKPIGWFCKPVRKDDGTLYCVVCSGQDFTEQERLREDIAVSRASFNSIVETTSDGVMVLDREGTVLYANRAAAKLFGRSEDALLGARFGLPIIPGEMAEVDIVSLQGGAGTAEMRVEATEWHGTPAHLAILRDVTERKRAERESMRAQKLESLGLIAGGIAHDFNNLLTGTLANISLAKLKIEEETSVLEVLSKAEKATLRAKDLTQQLLTFSKGGAPIRRSTGVDAILKDSVSLALSGSNVRCRLSLPRNLWPARVDPDQISQVFTNIIINADQSMPDGGKIKILVENAIVGEPRGEQVPSLKDGKYVKISFEDQGIGIPQADLPKLFDPYFTTKTKGDGLGLATAYSILNKHNGYLAVKSRVGSGSTFFVYLPASDAPPVEPAEVRSPGPIYGQGRVLVMDDEEAIRELLKEVLTVLGYSADCVADGDEALKMYREAMNSGNKYDVVIMDLTIPGGMGGKMAVKRLLELDPQATAIVSSGYSSDPVMSAFRDHGFKGIITKPYDVGKLSRAIADAIQV